MRLLVNASTLRFGGALQVAASFIEKSIDDPRGHVFNYAVSQQVYDTLGDSYTRAGKFTVVRNSPARLIKGRKTRSRLQQVESNFNPDVVFTVFGPAYVKFESIHCCGFASPWVTHPSTIALNKLPLLQRQKKILESRYKLLRLSRKDHYWVEAGVAQRGLSRLLDIPRERIPVIPNTYSSGFVGAQTEKSGNQDDSDIRVLCLAHPYPHKNLDIVPKVAYELRNSPKRFVFLMTLPEEFPQSQKIIQEFTRLGISHMVNNLGKVPLKDVPGRYQQADIVYLPTLLETYSATYPEAMVMRRPIVTSDLDFAHDICGRAALYTDHLSPQDAAKKIEAVVSDPDLESELVEQGLEMVSKLPGPDRKYELLMEWMEDVAEMS